LKIACIATSQIPSNTANSIQVMKACQALVQLGHRVELWVPASNRDAQSAQAGPIDWKELADWYGLSVPFKVNWVTSQPHWKRYDVALRAVRQAAGQGADLVYTWMPQAAVFGMLRGLPVILEMHDRPSGRFGPLLFRAFLRMQGKKRLVVITHALQHALEREYRYSFKEGEVVVAPNGVDPQRFQDLPGPVEARRSLGLPERITAGYTGHFYRGRGMDVLEHLARRFPQVQFLWVGGTPGAVEEWKARLNQAGIQNVCLTGFVENARLPLYQAAGEILLMPYERVIEGSSGGNSAEICSPMKMFEYMAAGRAILTSDLPVIREVLDDGSAVLCPPEDNDAWAAALAALLEDAPRREALAMRALDRAGEYTWLSRAERVIDGFL